MSSQPCASEELRSNWSERRSWARVHYAVRVEPTWLELNQHRVRLVGRKAAAYMQHIKRHLVIFPGVRELVREAAGSSSPIETPGGELPAGENESYQGVPEAPLPLNLSLEEGIRCYVDWLKKHPAAQGRARA